MNANAGFSNSFAGGPVQQAQSPQLQQAQSPQPGTKSSLLCKFFELGRCAKGNECHFAHGRHQLDLSTTQFDPTRIKTKMCKFAASGQFCARAESCPFAHSPEEIGSAGMQRGGDATAFGFG